MAVTATGSDSRRAEEASCLLSDNYISAGFMRTQFCVSEPPSPVASLIKNSSVARTLAYVFIICNRRGRHGEEGVILGLPCQQQLCFSVLLSRLSSFDAR